MTAKFLDDLHPGDSFVTGGITLTESEIIGFALTYDPQPFHLNAVVAAESIYGGLIASGFQVVALTFRLFISRACSLPRAWARRASTSCAGSPRPVRVTRCTRKSRCWR